MSLQIIAGRSGAGKTTRILNEIRSKLKNDPSGKPIIYLVPEQMTFLSEYKLARTPGLNGMISAQVYSFTRLAWRILQETGGQSRVHLSSSGINMMIAKIIEEKKNDLKLFHRSVGKAGFIANVERMLIELKRYCITPEMMKTSIRERLADEKDQSLKDKLHDLEIIYDGFETALFGKYIDSEDYLTLLAEKIDESAYLEDAEVYIDGFYNLTPQELLIVDQLMKKCRKVTMALTLDKPFREGPPNDFYLFGMSARLYDKIYRLALNSGITIEEDFFLDGRERFKESGSLGHLEKNFNIRPAAAYPGKSDAYVLAAVNRRAEIEAVAREILQMVREENVRWRDIAVLIRNGQPYHDLIRTIFQDYEIPFFIDAKESMLHHPLIELIRSGLETLQTNWRYEPVFRTIKTELLFPENADHRLMRRQVDQLENYVLSRGIKGDAWKNEEHWKYKRFRGLELEDRVQTDQELSIEKEINEMKNLFSVPLQALDNRCKRAKTGEDYCRALYLFLEEADVPKKLEALKMDAESKGQLINSRHHEQAWKAVVSLLDQFVEALGETEMPFKQFVSVLDAGLQALTFSQVPPAIDQVLVANMDLSRLNDISAAFVIGLNEGVLPMKPAEDGILSDSDRLSMNKAGIEVAPDSTVTLLDEEFTAYRAFVTPTRRLFLSYPLGDEEGGALQPSPYIQRVRDVLPDMEVRYVYNEPNEEGKEEQLKYMVNEDVAVTYLTSVLQVKKRGYAIDDAWYGLYNHLLNSESGRNKMDKALGSLFYVNKAKKLSKQTSKHLYGDPIVGSVSRMEKFNSCAFSHFATYGLRLKERKVFRLEAPDIGEMFHGALKIISDTLIEKNIPWSSLTKDDCRRLSGMAVEQLAPKLQNQILLSTNRHFYIKRKLENVINRASITLSEQAKHSGFVPFKLELGFGFGKSDQLPPLRFSLPDGTRMELVGRIDRVDKAEYNDEVYVRIIDYKSSTKDINMSEVYYGLALQMLTYLDVVLSNGIQLTGKETIPAGMLYFHVHNPFIKADDMLAPEQLEMEIFKQFKMKGLLLGEPEVLNMMDDHLVIGEKSSSNIISASFLKNGSLSKNSKVAGTSDFEALRNHTHSIYESAGSRIMDGETFINPYKLGDKLPCTYCSFKSVCQFDGALDENEYRILKPKSADEALTLIKGGSGDNE